MPKFLYTILILSVLLWWGLIKIFTTKAPDSPQIILVSVGLLFLALTLTFSIPIYFYFYKKVPNFTNLKFVYRKSFRWSGVFSLFITGVLALRAFNLATPINLTLFLILCAMIVLYLRGKR